jgi:glycolate oxidase FAD binding subunit
MGHAAGVLEVLRGAMEKEGGGLVLSEGPAGLMAAIGPWGSPGPEKTLVRGLKQEFDPQGILAPGRIGGIER